MVTCAVSRTGVPGERVLGRPREIDGDGDGFGKATGFTTCLEHGGLTVRVPADS